MKLISLELNNFQAIQHFRLDLNGHSATIRAKNGAGKSTIFNSYTWLLVDKPSTSEKNFSPKPKDVNGDDIHNLETSVEAVFQVDERTISLRKVFYEKWVSKKGSTEKTLDGHTTNFYIGCVEKTATEYNAFLTASFGSADRIKALILPGLFASDDFTLQVGKTKLSAWEHRRKVLLEIAGDISDEDIFAQNKELSNLPSILNGKTPEDAKKVFAKAMRDIDDQMKLLPPQIAEAEKAKPIVDKGTSISTIELDIMRVSESLAEWQQKRQSLLIANPTTELDKQIVDLQRQKLQLEEQQQIARRTKRQELSDICQEKNDAAVRVARQVAQARQEIADKQDRISQLQLQRERLLSRQSQVRATMFDGKICPTCEQVIPEDRLVDVRKSINIAKSTELEAIAKEGQKCHATFVIKPLQDEVVALEKTLQNLRDALTTANAELETARKVLADFEGLREGSDEIKAVNVKIAELEIQRNAPTENPNAEAIAEIDGQLLALNERLEQLRTVKINLEIVEKQNLRVSELKRQEKELAVEYEKNERGNRLCGEFIKTKVNMLTDKINNLIPGVKFRLFRDTISGDEPVPCCDVFVCDDKGNLVPFSGAINKAHGKIAMVEICEALGRYWGVNLPIFVDDGENIVNEDLVDKLMKRDAQVIRLVADKEHENLFVEIEN